jgi:septal ring factor EnvC (AmiA/AmiB activator)
MGYGFSIRIAQISVALTLIAFIPSGFAAQSPQEEYRKVQKDLRTHQKKLESVKKVEQSVIEELTKVTAELKEIQSQLTKQRAKIKQLRTTITTLEGEISLYKQKLNSQTELLKKRLRIMDRLALQRDALLMLLSGEDTAQMMRITRYLKDISAYDYALITIYKDTVAKLNGKQQELKKSLASLTSEETKLAQLEHDAHQKKKERETLLVAVRKEKGAYERMIADLKESSGKLQKIIQDAEKRERELRKKRGVKPSDDMPDDSTFSRFKGSLPWPVSGSIVLNYGQQVDPIFNLPVFRSGIHIKAPANSPVTTVHAGKVVFADNFKGYNQLVIVSHGGGYHTLYGYLSKIFLKNGAIIKENQPIGEAGESSTIGSSGIYFEIRYKGKPLDPQQWLRK